MTWISQRFLSRCPWGFWQKLHFFLPVEAKYKCPSYTEKKKDVSKPYLFLFPVPKQACFAEGQ